VRKLKELMRREIDAQDSLNQPRLIAQIEEGFHISLTHEEVTYIASLRDVDTPLAECGVI
jgi:hypothetical protein